MSSGFDITGIGGYNPYMSGLGGFGLGGASSFGSYNSYDPTMMAGIGYGGMGLGMGSGLGMMGMYNPAFMSQMNNAHQNIELDQLRHSSAMHDMLLQNKVDAYKAEDSAMFKKSIEDSAINKHIVNLAEKIREGDTDGICQEYDRLKISLYQKYADVLRANSDRLDPSETINGHIEDLYAAIITKKSGEQVSLRNDLKRYGETAFMHGFNNGFLGKKDYHGKYTEETINYLFGERIDNKGGKDRLEKIGGVLGRISEGGVAAGTGYATGLGLAGLAAMFTPSKEVVTKTGEKVLKNRISLKGSNRFALLSALALTLADAWWQVAR